MQLLTHPSRPLKDIISIHAFKAEEDEIKEIYPRTYALPEFFLHNLLASNRVVKSFTGHTALIEAFYYQLMKLVIEYDNEDNFYKQMVFQKIVGRYNQDEKQLDDLVFTDFQYRKFLKDFIEIAEKERTPNFERTAEEYPIIDQILKKIFGKLTPYPLAASLTDPSVAVHEASFKLFSFLCQQFGITLSVIGPCFKFEQSDIFVYLQNTDEVYLAFNDELQSEMESQSNFTSTFKCGEDNSFLTKYHSISANKSSNSSKTVKPFKRSKFFTKGEQSWDLKSKSKFQRTPPPLKSISVSNNQSSNQVKFDNSFKESAFFQKKQSPVLSKQELYSQFTSTFILQQLSPQLKQNVSTIKARYRSKREAVNHFV